jgi:hypothetical protein
MVVIVHSLATPLATLLEKSEVLLVAVATAMAAARIRRVQIEIDRYHSMHNGFGGKEHGSVD